MDYYISGQEGKNHRVPLKVYTKMVISLKLVVDLGNYLDTLLLNFVFSSGQHWASVCNFEALYGRGPCSISF